MQCVPFILGKAYYGFEGVYWEYVFMHEVENIKYGVMKGGDSFCSDENMMVSMKKCHSLSKKSKSAEEDRGTGWQM